MESSDLEGVLQKKQLAVRRKPKNLCGYVMERWGQRRRSNNLKNSLESLEKSVLRSELNGAFRKKREMNLGG